MPREHAHVRLPLARHAVHEGEQCNDDHDRTCDEQDFIPTALVCEQVGMLGVRTDHGSSVGDVLSVRIARRG